MCNFSMLYFSCIVTLNPFIFPRLFNVKSGKYYQRGSKQHWGPANDCVCKTRNGHSWHHGVDSYTGWTFPCRQGHHHHLLQDLSPDACILRHQKYPGGNAERVQDVCYMSGLQPARGSASPGSDPGRTS